MVCTWSVIQLIVAQWRHIEKKTGPTLIQVMACCLMAPTNHLMQCWLTIKGVHWHFHLIAISQAVLMNFIRNMCTPITFLNWITRTSLRGQGVKNSFTTCTYSDVLMGAMASQITCVSIVYSTVCSAWGPVQRKHKHDDVIKWKHFCVTGHLCGDYTGHRRIPRKGQ